MSAGVIGGLRSRVWLAFLGLNSMTALIEGVTLTCLPLVATTFLHRADLVPLITVLRTAPLVLVSIPAGVLADTGHRRTTLRASVFIGAVGGVLLAVTGINAGTGPAVLAVAAFLLGVAQAAHSVVATTIPGLLLEEEDRPKGNARAMMLASTLGFILGPAVGGVLGTVGPASVGTALTGCYTIALLWVVRMRLLEPGDATAHSLSVRLRSIGAAAKALVSSQELLAATSVSICSTLAYGITIAVLPLLITQTFRLPGNVFGALIAAGSLASIAGASVASRLARRRIGHTALLVSGTAAFCGYLSMAVSASEVGLFAGYILASASLAVWSVVATSLRQRLIPQEMMGRSMSVYMLLVMVATPVGAALSALLLPTVPLQGIMITATSILAMGILTMFILQWRNTRPSRSKGDTLNG